MPKRATPRGMARFPVFPIRPVLVKIDLSFVFLKRIGAKKIKNNKVEVTTIKYTKGVNRRLKSIFVRVSPQKVRMGCMK